MYNRKQYFQERLAKEDIRLLIEAIETSEYLTTIATDTRIELLKGKLKRMGKAMIAGQGNPFICATCGEQFISVSTEEQAQAERKANGFENDECVVVCDDCYRRLGFEP